MNLYLNKGLPLYNFITDNNPINKNHYSYFDQMISNYYNSFYLYNSPCLSSYKKNNLYINTSNTGPREMGVLDKHKIDTIYKIEDEQSIEDSLINSKNIKRCGIIFIKDFLDEGRVLNIQNKDEFLYNKLRKILIVKGKSGIWSLPKGRINITNTDKGQIYSENEYECASREAYEETGIYINPLLLEKLPKMKINRNTYFILDLNNILFNNGKLGLYIKPLDLIYNFNEPIYKYINFSDYYNINKMDTFEIDEIDWKTIDEMNNLRCNKDIRNLLKKLKLKK
jgi:8-oxo-dGTP pyrophosphatase MutT (NUDIX family)